MHFQAIFDFFCLLRYFPRARCEASLVPLKYPAPASFQQFVVREQLFSFATSCCFGGLNYPLRWVKISGASCFQVWNKVTLCARLWVLVIVSRCEASRGALPVFLCVFY